MNNHKHSESESSWTISYDKKRTVTSDTLEEKTLVDHQSSTLGEAVGQQTGGKSGYTSISHIKSIQPTKVWEIGLEENTASNSHYLTTIKAVAWSPDSKHIVFSKYDNTVQIWDIVNGVPLANNHRQLDPVVAIAWSPNGKYIACSNADKTVKIWNVSTGQEVLTYLGHNHTIWSIAWSPNSIYIATGSEDKTVRVWNAFSGDTTLIYQGHFGPVETTSWSPDSQHIASGSDDKTVRVWDAMTGNDIYIYQGHSNIVTTVSWSPDSKRIASGSDLMLLSANKSIFTKNSTIQIWDATTGNHSVACDTNTFRIYAINWSPDSSYIVSGSFAAPGVHIYDASTGEIIAMLHLPGPYKEIGEALSVAWSASGTYIAVSFSSGQVAIWPTL